MSPLVTRTGTEYGEFIYHNSYGVINTDVMQALKDDSNVYARHSAMHFTGYIWFDRVTGQWYEEVCRYHQHLITVSDINLDRLIRKVNNDYGLS